MNSIVIFLSVFFIQIYSDENTFDCTGQKDDSFHPMLNDCRFYWHCIFVDTVYMRAVKRVCPAGTKFDIRVNECEWANSVSLEILFFFPGVKHSMHIQNRSIVCRPNRRLQRLLHYLRPNRKN